MAQFVKGASITEQFRDFGRGVLSLSGLVFFLSIILLNLYLSMVLIGRRHWVGGTGGRAMTIHFIVRSLALVAAIIGVNIVVQRFDVRADVSQERVNSLSPQTMAMLRSLDTPRPVFVEAYISPHVPEGYVQTRLNLISMLREAHAMAGDGQQAMAAGCDDFDTKPVELPRLLEKIETWLRKARG